MSVLWVNRMGKEKEFVDLESTAEDIMLVWGMVPMKQNLAKVTLPPRSHVGRDEEEKMRWSLVEGFSSLKGVDLKAQVAQGPDKTLSEGPQGAPVMEA